MRREYRGAAQGSVLTAFLGSSNNELTIQCNDQTNWPTGINSRSFCVVIDKGKANEEKILVSRAAQGPAMTRLRVKRIRRKHRWQFGISSNPWMDSFSIHWLHSEYLVWIEPREQDEEQP